MEGFNAALAVLGLLVIALTLLSRRVLGWPVSAAAVAMAVGMALGSHGLGLVAPSPPFAPQILEQAARVVLATGLMSVALSLPRGYFLAHWRSLAVLYAVVMPIMTLVTAGLAHVVLSMPWLQAFIVGAITTPTDPILARSVVTGQLAERHLPSRLRTLLLAESGANDGLAYPIVTLPLALGYQGRGAVQWVLRDMVLEVGGAIVVGLVLGWAVGRALAWSRERGLVDAPHGLSVTVSLSLLALGAGGLLGVNGILEVFVTGVAFAATYGNDRLAREGQVQDALNEIATVAIFLLLGMMAPWQQWLQWGALAVVFAAAVLVLRRLPALLLLARTVPAISGAREAALAGWFGPVGVGAIFYATFACARMGSYDKAWTVPTLVVAASVLAYAVTTPFIVKRQHCV